MPLSLSERTLPQITALFMEASAGDPPKKNKKFELMLTRRAKAYSSSGSVA